MLLREKVAEWLDSLDDVTNVRPVQVRLHSLEWQGATFIRGDEQVYYLIGKRPRHHDPTCYLLQPFDLDDVVSSDWYIGGYIEKSPNEKTKVHPFGTHWILVPWIIKSDPESQIDDYADEPYKRTILAVKEYQ